MGDGREHAAATPPPNQAGRGWNAQPSPHSICPSSPQAREPCTRQRHDHPAARPELGSVIRARQTPFPLTPRALVSARIPGLADALGRGARAVSGVGLYAWEATAGRSRFEPPQSPSDDVRAAVRAVVGRDQGVAHPE